MSIPGSKQATKTFSTYPIPNPRSCKEHIPLKIPAIYEGDSLGFLSPSWGSSSAFLFALPLPEATARGWATTPLDSGILTGGFFFFLTIEVRSLTLVSVVISVVGRVAFNSLSSALATSSGAEAPASSSGAVFSSSIYQARGERWEQERIRITYFEHQITPKLVHLLQFGLDLLGR